MKKTTLILAAIFMPALTVFAETPAASADEVIRLSEPVAVTETYEVFGAEMQPVSEPMTLGQLVAERDQYLGTEVIVSTEIVEVCQKKGCFFIARDGAAVARITFKDYGFFIPTDSGGKTVTLKGVFAEQKLSREQAEHLASDLGGSPASIDPLEYAIVATSVQIPKS